VAAPMSVEKNAAYVAVCFQIFKLKVLKILRFLSDLLIHYRADDKLIYVQAIADVI